MTPLDNLLLAAVVIASVLVCVKVIVDIDENGEFK